MRQILRFFTGSLWVPLLAAMACAAAGLSARNDLVGRQAMLAEMAARPAPAAIGIDVFQRAFSAPQVEEVHLEGRIDPALAIRFAAQGNPFSGADIYLLPMFAPDDLTGAQAVRGGVVLTAAQYGTFAEWMMRQPVLGGVNDQLTSTGVAQMAPRGLALRGLLQMPTRQPDVAGLLAARSLTAATQFVYVAPFLEDRMTALTKAAKTSFWRERGALALAAVFGFLALIGCCRRVFWGGTAPALQPNVLAVGGKARGLDAVANPAQARAPFRLSPVRLVGALAGVGLLGLCAVSYMTSPVPLRGADESHEAAAPATFAGSARLTATHQPSGASDPSAATSDPVRQFEASASVARLPASVVEETATARSAEPAPHTDAQPATHSLQRPQPVAMGVAGLAWDDLADRATGPDTSGATKADLFGDIWPYAPWAAVLLLAMLAVLPGRISQLAVALPTLPGYRSARLSEDPFDRLAARIAADRASAA
ncbi:MAG: hypothetical protein Q7J57_14290 [Gemmobacter sp.]|nr:hypothetical protein [Gemmobacter sp.]